MLFQGEWFALQVKVHKEYQVAAILRSKGYEEFLPTRPIMKHNTSLQAPLFPGYVFCRTSPEVHGLMVTTPGVIRIVKFGNKPARIDPEELRSIQLAVDSGAPIYVSKGLHIGDKVRIQNGPLRGVIGILSSMYRRQRLLISITMMMRTVVAEVDPEWVTTIKPPESALSLYKACLPRTA